METILLGAVVTLALEVSKALHKRFVNPQVESAVIIVAGFAVSFVVSLVVRTVPHEMLTTTVQVWASSIALYEVAYARIISPVLIKLFPSE